MVRIPFHYHQLLGMDRIPFHYHRLLGMDQIPSRCRQVPDS